MAGWVNGTQTLNQETAAHVLCETQINSHLFQLTQLTELTLNSLNYKNWSYVRHLIILTQIIIITILNLTKL